MRLNLSERETELLRDLLHDHLPELQREVARTERHELRHELVERQDFIEQLLERLGSDTPSVAARET
jgi:hypothetical protein